MDSRLLALFIPWRLQLTVLQQEHYEVGRFLKWIFRHFFERKPPQKKKLVWTRKAMLISLSSILLVAAFFALFALWLGSWGIVAGVLLASQPWVAFVIVQGLLFPLETHRKQAIIGAAKRKLASFPNVQVIGIAGSYGKTSMKTILTHLLKGWRKVLSTPLSYNVPLGIARVIDLELTKRYDFFVVEMGEFYRGDIKELCDMLHPKAGMITGLNAQHAERLGTIEQAGATLFELADFLLPSGKSVYVNAEDKNITSHVRSHGMEGRVKPYASTTSALRAEHIRFTDEGTSFHLVMASEDVPVPSETLRINSARQSRTEVVIIPLLGAGQVTNILGALEMALGLGAPLEHLLKRLETLPQVPHRLERKTWDNGMLLIDDAYNSNVDGFRQALDVLSKLPRTNKVLVTPGIIELGDLTRPIHHELGTIANEACNLVVLVGRSERTEALAASIRADKQRWITDIKELWAILPEICPDPKDSVVLLENDLPESAM